MMRRLLVRCTLLLITMVLFSGCQKDKVSNVTDSEKPTATNKGYDLTINDNMKKTASSDCEAAMNAVKSIYSEAKQQNKDVLLSMDQEKRMLKQLEAKGYVAMTSSRRYNMVHWQQVDTFYTQVKQWDYTEKGWFVYELYVPQPPDVSEVVNGTDMFRVKPLNDEYRQIAYDYLQPIGYQGNNLFLIDWDRNNMEKIDYNGLYESLYLLKYQTAFDETAYDTGIPKEEFESIMMEYLPVSEKLLQKQAHYNTQMKQYAWTRLGCGNYAPDSFGTSYPEIIDWHNNEDGTTTWTIDAICEMDGCECMFTHELTVRIFENGGIQLVSNHIRSTNGNDVLEYRYRIQ